MGVGGNYLLRRDSRSIAFRCRVPTALIGVVGKREIVRSLETEHIQLARAMAAGIALSLYDLWKRLRSMDARNEVSILIEVWFKRELDRAFRHYHSGDVAEAPATRALTDDIQDDQERQTVARSYAMQLADHDLEQLQEDHRIGSFGRGFEATNEIIGELDRPFDKGDQRYTIIAREILSAQAAIADSRFRWAGGEVGYRPEWTPDLPPAIFPTPVVVPLQSTTTTLPPQSVPLTRQSARPISVVFTAYARERKFKRKTEVSFGRAVSRFIELHGDLCVQDILPHHIVSFKDALLQVPINLPNKVTQLPLPDLVERFASERALPRVSAQTVNNKWLAAVSATLGYARANALISSNPASDIRALEPRSTGEPPVIGFDLNELGLLFASPVFSNGFRPVGGAGGASVWLPLIALYTGARREEIGRLIKGDIRETDGIVHFFIREGKTAAARRNVPVHSKLLELGLLDYVSQMTGDDPVARIFPRLKEEDDGSTTEAWGKWFSRYLDKHVTDDPSKKFHSFRHTAKHELTNNGCSDSLSEALLGHDDDSVPKKYGRTKQGHRFKLDSLQKGIELIRYEGIEMKLFKENS